MTEPNGCWRMRVLLTAAALLCADAASAERASRASLLMPHPALTTEECDEAIMVASVVEHQYAGRLSARLFASFRQFRESRCNLDTRFVRVNGTSDEEAYREFRVKLIGFWAVTRQGVR